MRYGRMIALIVSAVALPLGSNSSTAHAQASCNGDVNGDHVVDGQDLAGMLNQWGSCAPTWATVLEWDVNPTIVTDPALRAAITATRLPWRVRDNLTNIEMVLIPQGSFTMGCKASLNWPCNSDENPTHAVTLTSAFYLARYELTQAQWTAVMGSNPSFHQGSSYPNAASRPVERVSWNAVASFNTATGMRFPTEAEWEYAYRAQLGPSATRYAFHNNTNDDALVGTIAWYGTNSNNQSQPVGGKTANALGLYDMAGNIWEFCNDWYGSSYYSSSPSTNPTGPLSGTGRVLRGGSWDASSRGARGSQRSFYALNDIHPTVGVRTAKTAPPACSADVNGDHVVDGQDLAGMLNQWGSCAPTWATVLEWDVNPTIVTDPELSAAITATGLPWRVRDNGTNIEMVLIPQGSFIMGCTGSSNWSCQGNENPTHAVTLTNAFYLARYEVTQAQWTAKIGNNPSFHQGSSFPDAPNRPVERVSWNNIASFNALTGLRLPTEAEWEFAYRAQLGTSVTRTAFHNGTNVDWLAENTMWYGANSNNQTHVVGGKLANALGLYDMAGNIWECCSDWFGSTYYSSSPSVNPAGPSSGTFRVLRGGCWAYNTDECRASQRGVTNLTDLNTFVGFRPARNP